MNRPRLAVAVFAVFIIFYRHVSYMLPKKVSLKKVCSVTYNTVLQAFVLVSTSQPHPLPKPLAKRHVIQKD